jgi:hypothetical protein
VARWAAMQAHVKNDVVADRARSGRCTEMLTAGIDEPTDLAGPISRCHRTTPWRKPNRGWSNSYEYGPDLA